MPDTELNKPGLDKEANSSMTSKKKEVEIDGVMVEVDDIRSVQLNEKLSDSVYQILHPETDAYQVITDSERRFVSDTEKRRWNQAYKLGATALHYRGAWTSGEAYYQYDVVHIDSGESYTGAATTADGRGRRFFIYTNASATPDTEGINNTKKPSADAFIDGDWVNINFESYLAEYANNIKVVQPITEQQKASSFNLAVFDASNNSYKMINEITGIQVTPESNTITIVNSEEEVTIKLDGQTGTITATKFIGDISGVADQAKYAEAANRYIEYQTNVDGSLAKDVNNNYIPRRNQNAEGYEYTQEPLIAEALGNLSKRLYDMQNGGSGVQLSHTITVQKNGVPLHDPFNGAKSEVANIVIKTEDVTDLLEDGKIKDEWLPDALLGALKFIGTFDPSDGTMKNDLREEENGVKRPFAKGDYAIAISEGNYDPSKKYHQPVSNDDSDTGEDREEEATFFITGDWAVFNGDVDGDQTIDPEEWVKVDNTDAVRTVNNQIGNVKTFKGPWKAGNQYYAGDIVKYGNPEALYLCIKDHRQEADAEFPDGLEGRDEYFQIFGRIYKAADGIELTQNDNTFRHEFKEAVETIAGTTESPAIELQPEQVIPIGVSYINDIYGHVKTNNVTYYKMPEDTWRPVSVNNTEYQGKKVNTGNLNLTHALKNGEDDARITVSFDTENNKVVFNHELSLEKKGSHTSEVLTTPEENLDDKFKIGLGSQFSLPTFGWGDTGHIDSYEKVVLELPKDLIQHKHFYVDLVDGRSIIRSFTAKQYGEITNNADKHRLFVDAEESVYPADHTYAGERQWVVPALNQKDKMTFTGRLGAKGFFQTGRLEASEMFRVVDESANVYGGHKMPSRDGSVQEIVGSFNIEQNRFELGDTGILGPDADDTSIGVYSAVAVNRQGLAIAGGQILEFGSGSMVDGEWVSEDPSDHLVIGGLFFRNIGPKIDDNGAGVDVGAGDL